MTLNAIEVNEYPAEIRLLEEGDLVLGGLEGPDNRALIQLANRTNWLKLQLANITPGGGGNLPPLPEGVPYWTFLGINATVEEVKARPLEGYPEYSYVLCLGHVWAIVNGAWEDVGSFAAPGGSGGDPGPFPQTNFMGVLEDPASLSQIPASSYPDYSYLLCKGYAYIAVGGEWNKTASFESGTGGGDPGGGGSFPEAPIDGIPYVRKDGAWEAFHPDRRLSRHLTETSTIDPNIGVFWTLDNSMPDLKTINLKNGPGRYPDNYEYAITVTLVIRGIAGELKFVPEENVNIYWHKGTQPMLYAGRTVIILLWDGNDWIGSTGAQSPTSVF